jgi:hypothetical protein
MEPEIPIGSFKQFLRSYRNDGVSPGQLAERIRSSPLSGLYLIPQDGKDASDWLSPV